MIPGLIASFAAGALMSGATVVTALQHAPATVERVGDAPDKVICKTFPVTGSLALTHKVCGTKRDWEIQRQMLRESAVVDSCRSRAEGGAC